MPFLINFFHLTWCFQGSSILQHVSTLIAKQYSLCGNRTFYLPIHKLMGIYIASALELLQVMLLWIFMYRFSREHMYLPRSRIAKAYDNSVFNFLRNCQTLLTLAVQESWAPVPLLSCQYLLFEYSNRTKENVYGQKGLKSQTFHLSESGWFKLNGIYLSPKRLYVINSEV